MKIQAIQGLKNEEDIITYLNGKTLNMLDSKWKKHIQTIFPFAKDDDVVYARKFPDHQAKPDAILKVRHTCHYLSIKSGRNPSVHQEDYFSFQHYLKRSGTPENIIRTIYFFHFGQTKKLDNNGKPFTKDEMEAKYSEYFKKACLYLNRKDVIDSIIYRTVIKGANAKRNSITYIYYGNLEKGFLLSIEDIYSLIENYYNHTTASLHFGGLVYQPGGRKRTTQDYRYVRIKWPILSLLYYKDEDEIRDIVDGKIIV